MQQSIKPLGIATAPSDYGCTDGELSASFNLINEDGALRPLPQPVDTGIQLTEGDNILCIHTTPVFKHYIASNNDSVVWYDSGDTIRHTIDLGNDNTVYKVTPIGNTLAVLAGTGLFYLLWNYENSTYTNLGSKPPELNMQFGVSAQKSVTFGQYQRTEQLTNFTTEELEELATHFTHRTSGHPFLNIGDTNFAWTKIDDNGQEEVTNAVWALINSSNAKIAKEGYFYAPFIVRYCYRFYDGSMSMHSAPVFIPVASPFPYQVGFTGMSNGSTGDYFEISQFVYYFNSVALTYMCDPSLLNELKQWKDLITSVDVFVSLPLTREDSSEKITAAHTDSTGEQIRYANNTLSPHTTWRQYIFNYAGNDYTSNMNTIFDIPMLYTEEEYWDKVKSVSDFYKIASYDINDTTTGLVADGSFHDVNIRTGVLSTLATQEAMKDDYHSHNDILPTIDSNGNCITSLFNYNSRLSVTAATERIFKGFPIETMLPAETSTTRQNGIRAIVVHIKTEHGNKRVVYDYGPDNVQSASALLLTSLPLFYPDNRAYRMDIVINQSVSPPELVLHLAMKQHPLLNGATTNGALITSLSHSYNLVPVGVPSLTPNDLITTLNQIRTSEVDNPFYHPAINYKTVGVGTILGLSAAAKALSQGQFGQFPLYAFCTDGVWAMGVDSSDGTLMPAQPFTRDVCSNPDGILQLDNTILFPTDRGIMLVSGSQTQCITDKLDYPHFDLSALRGASQFAPDYNPVPMREYIKGCKMLYDYRNQRVIVFFSRNTGAAQPVPEPYAYVYSLKSGLWGMMASNLRGTLNAYPDAMAVTSGNKLVGFPDASDAASMLKPQFYLTRPFKLGSPDDLKTVTAIVQHGMVEDKERVKTILYGSRDLVHWHVVGSSTTGTLRGISGTPYAYFRLFVIADLAPTESLSDFSVEFTMKHTRVLR